MTTTSDIISAAMALPAEQRAEVAHQLLLSLEPIETNSDNEQAWSEQVRSRLKAIREAKTSLRDWNDALVDIRQSLVGRGE